MLPVALCNGFCGRVLGAREFDLKFRSDDANYDFRVLRWIIKLQEKMNFQGSAVASRQARASRFHSSLDCKRSNVILEIQFRLLLMGLQF